MEEFEGTIVSGLYGLLNTVAADENRGSGLEVGVNKGIGGL